ncbi:hypothetical protein B1R32_1441, partial [Abditibacterium utsteinense]
MSMGISNENVYFSHTLCSFQGAQLSSFSKTIQCLFNALAETNNPRRIARFNRFPNFHFSGLFFHASPACKLRFSTTARQGQEEILTP